MAWCTYCLFSYCSELDLLHLLRREHPSNLDRLAGVARQTVLEEFKINTNKSEKRIGVQED